MLSSNASKDKDHTISHVEFGEVPFKILKSVPELKGNCNAKIKNSFMLEIDSSSCIHDRKIVLDLKFSLC